MLDATIPLTGFDPLRVPAGKLRVGGLTALTTLDYPGALAAVLYCQGCPWRCAYCHNADLQCREPVQRLDWSAVQDFLHERRGLLDAVVFSGGEPTQQVALAAAIGEVRGLGFKVGLHTAGPWPQRLAAVLPLLDWVGLDIKALPEDYPLITGIPGSGARAWESLRRLLGARVPFEVRTTPMPGLDDAAYLNRLMQRLASVGVRDYALQQCRNGQPSASALSPRPLPAHWPDQPFPRFTLRGVAGAGQAH